MSDTPFIYLLNRMESAASDVNPHMSGYPRHRKAVLDHVAQLSTDLAEALAVIGEILASDGSEGIYNAMKIYDARERARAIRSKHSKT